MRNNQKEKKCHHGRNANDEKVKKKANLIVKNKFLQSEEVKMFYLQETKGIGFKKFFLPMTSQLNKSHLTIYMNKAIQTQTSRMLQVIHVKLTFFTGGWPLPTPRLSSTCCYETCDLYEDRTHDLRVTIKTLLPPELTSHTLIWKINL